MNRFITTLFLFLCTCYFTFAQVYMSSNMAAQRPAKILDISAMQVIYQVSSLPDSLVPNGITKDTMILQIGQNLVSKYYPDTRLRDSIMQARMAQMQAQTATESRVTVTASIQNQRMGTGDQSIIFKNWPTGNITVTDRVMMDSYSYTETFNEIEWHILPETDTLLTYLCQKAVTTFRGRSYEAWFTPDIPINEGPWKFCKLPGLILKVSDNRNHYLFECIGMEQAQAPIEFADLDYLKTNRRDLARIKRRFNEDPMAALNTAMENMRSAMPIPAGANVNTTRVIRGVDTDGTPMDESELRNRMRNRGYNPIELDY